tara:strand:- start:2760 stop:3419 length:660 start_codon:yes stop_codon:yes gene_type:complete
MNTPRRYKVFYFYLKLSILILVSITIFSSSGFPNNVPRLAVLGDSLTAGYGLSLENTFPEKLKEALKRLNVPAVIINSGVSGDTTAGGLSRLEWLLLDKPTHVMIQLGANDMLRGINPEAVKRNLDDIVIKLKSKSVKVMLLGMYASPNLGRHYAEEYETIFPDLAKKHKILLYPFFLDGVASEQNLNQDDGIHPNKKGVAVIVKRILPTVIKFIGSKD